MSVSVSVCLCICVFVEVLRANYMIGFICSAFCFFNKRLMGGGEKK